MGVPITESLNSRIIPYMKSGQLICFFRKCLDEECTTSLLIGEDGKGDEISSR